MEDHVKVIAILWIISGVFGLFLAFTVFCVLFGVSFIPDVDYQASKILRVIAIWGGIFFAILTAPEIIGGIRLIKKKEWGRILVLIVSFFNLIWFPIWTALGIYSIVILVNKETVQNFKASQ